MGDSGEVETGLHESSHGVVKNSWTLILGDVMVGVITRDEQEAVFAIAWREGGKRDRLLSTNSQMDQGSYTNEEVSLNQRILLDNHLETHIPARFACRACLWPGWRGGCERRGNERLRTGFWSRPLDGRVGGRRVRLPVCCCWPHREHLPLREDSSGPQERRRHRIPSLRSFPQPEGLSKNT